MDEPKIKNPNNGLIGKQLEHILTGHIGRVAWELHCLNLNWAKIVGEKACPNCRPGRISNETLWIAVKSSVWMQELSYRKETIIKKANNILQDIKIKDLRWIQWQEQDNLPDKKREYTPDTVEINPQQAEKFRQMSKIISDKNCRNALFEMWESFQKNKKRS